MSTVAARAAAASRSVAASEVARAAVDPSPVVRREAAAHPAARADVLVALAADRDWRTRATVAARHDAPAAAHQMLINDRAWQVLHTLGDNPSVDPDVWRAIASSGSRHLRAYLAGRSFLPLEVAGLLLTDTSTEVRSNLASQTPHRVVLDALLVDPHPHVRCDALRNRMVDLGDTDRAVHDPHHLVRAEAATWLPVRASDLDRLAHDRSAFVRDQACGRQRSPGAPAPGGRYPPAAHQLPGLAVAEAVPTSTPRDVHDVARWPATPRKPTTRWFRLFSQYHPASDEIPDHVIRLWRVAKRIDADSGWAAWWEPAPYRVLDISLRPAGPPGNQVTPADDTLYVQGRVFVPVSFAAGFDTLGEDAADVLFGDLLFSQLAVTFAALAADLGLEPPPPLPASW